MSHNISHYPDLIKKIPEEVHHIFDTFLKKGDEIRLVGGCVRDLLINKPVNDFDFATTLVPEEMMKILRDHNIKAIPTGIKFGTVTAVVNRKNFEITTLRKELETDGRHCQAEFVDDYLLDAQRRDFTINALYMDDKGNITDYFDGISDLQKREVKFIGDANQRVKEDYLRILRFFRFSCYYANTLDEHGLSVCVAHKERIKTLSRERVRVEFLKLIASQNNANLLNILEKIESKMALDIFATGFDYTHLEQLFELEERLGFKADVNLKLAALFLFKIVDLKEFVVQLCATNKEKQYIKYLLDNISYISQPIALGDVKKMLAFDNIKYVRDLYILNMMQHFDDQAPTNFAFLEQFSLPAFPLTGDDMKDLGLTRKHIGKALREAKEFWALNGFSASKEELLDLVRRNLLI